MHFPTIFLVLMFYGTLGIKVQVKIPVGVQVGDTVTLECSSDLEDRKLTRVVWEWRATQGSTNKEFYRYSTSRILKRGKKQNKPVTAFSVNMVTSSSEAVVLEKITKEAAGTFTCHVHSRDRRVKPGQASGFMLVSDKQPFVWSEEATKMLIELYKTRVQRFEEISDSEQQEEEIWGEIANEMGIHSFVVTGSQCASRWSDLLKEYNQSQTADTNSEITPKPFLYIAEMDAIFQKKLEEPIEAGVADLLAWLQREKKKTTESNDRILEKMQAMMDRAEEIHTEEMQLLNELKRFYF